LSQTIGLWYVRLHFLPSVHVHGTFMFVSNHWYTVRIWAKGTCTLTSNAVDYLFGQRYSAAH